MNKQRANTKQEKSTKNLNKKEFSVPLKRTLNFRLLIDFWKNTILTDKALGKLYSATLTEQLTKVPQLLEPIRDLSLLDEHQELIEILMSAIFPPARKEKEIAAAFIPFTHQAIYSTPAYNRLFDYIEKCNEEKKSLDDEKIYLVIMLNAYKAILKVFYNMVIDFDFPWIMYYADQKTGLERYYKIEVDSRFIEIKNRNAVKPLTQNEKKRLHDNLTDLNVWQEIIPIENFEFQGFAIYKATDVTDNELLSQLNYEMSKKDALNSEEMFNRIQHKMRSLFKLPQLKLGLSGIMGEKDLLHNCGHAVGRSLFLSLTEDYCPVNFQKSIYGRLLANRKPVIVLDLSKYTHRTTIEDEFIKNGLNNIALFPLLYNDELIGVVELAAPDPSVINAINTLKLDSLMPLFVMAIKRNLEELQNSIQSIIKEQCTAIHPSVEWRFRNAAFNKIQKENLQGFTEMEPIIFDNVFSLYGLSDIRGSSTQRNHVIQEDLIDQLSLAKKAIDQAYDSKPMPILQELMYRIDNYRSNIAKGLNSDEEGRVLDFLHSEIEPLFDHLQDYNKKVESRIKVYRDALDADLGFVYNKRRDFEESLAHINDTISAYIDAEEEKAQKMFPHYFEKYKTDGVDYNIYVGPSLVENQEFNLIYLRNLRLWQLILMCGIVDKAKALKKELTMPLDTAHLILVQSTPISIQFRFDEKRFDVNGAYNVKYEIVKKRIDKATIKSTGERLTQPGKIAIVYSQSKDAYEYREYIDYLQHSGYIEGEVEDVELEDLQGVQGLRALRITVNTKSLEHAEELVPESVEQAIREMSQ
jgi:hypothetical protein